MPSDEPVIEPGPAVIGVITLPEDAELPEGATWSVELQDSSKMDVAAEVLGTAEGEVEDTSATEISFDIEFDADAIDPRLVTTGYTLSAMIYDADGNLLYINDTSTPAFEEGQAVGQSTEPVEVEVVDVQGAAAEPMAEEPMAEESPAT